jgi:hypothetical protein
MTNYYEELRVRREDLHNFRVKARNWLRRNPGWHSSQEIRMWVIGWQPDQLARVLLNTPGIETKIGDTGHRRLWKYETDLTP